MCCKLNIPHQTHCWDAICGIDCGGLLMMEKAVMIVGRNWKMRGKSKKL
jgi:hypothetical protein